MIVLAAGLVALGTFVLIDRTNQTTSPVAKSPAVVPYTTGSAMRAVAPTLPPSRRPT